MSRLQFETQVSPEGLISLPPIPELHGRKVVVSVEDDRTKSSEKPFLRKKPKATPEEAQAFMDACYGCLEGVSDEEFQQMKTERILGTGR